MALIDELLETPFPTGLRLPDALPVISADLSVSEFHEVPLTVPQRNEYTMLMRICVGFAATCEDYDRQEQDARRDAKRFFYREVIDELALIRNGAESSETRRAISKLMAKLEK